MKLTTNFKNFGPYCDLQNKTQTRATDGPKLAALCSYSILTFLLPEVSLCLSRCLLPKQRENCSYTSELHGGKNCLL